MPILIRVMPEERGVPSLLKGILQSEALAEKK
jgi:hypothetical protein